MYKPHHGPMSNNWVLMSFLGIIIAVSIWKLSPGWAFLLILFSIIMFLSSYISAVRAPLASDEEIEIAIHEKFNTKRYPDTDLHEGLIPKTKKIVHTKHKKKLVSLILESSRKKSVSKKVVAKKRVTKKVVKKVVRKPIKKKVSQRHASKKVSKKPARKLTVKRKVIKKKVVKKAAKKKSSRKRR